MYSLKESKTLLTREKHVTQKVYKTCLKKLVLQHGFYQSSAEYSFRISLKEKVFVIKDGIMEVLARNLNTLLEKVA